MKKKTIRQHFESIPSDFIKEKFLEGIKSPDKVFTKFTDAVSHEVLQASDPNRRYLLLGYMDAIIGDRECDHMRINILYRKAYAFGRQDRQTKKIN